MKNTAAFLIVLLSSCSVGTYKPSKVNVSIMAHQCIENELRSPATAEFSNYGSEKITQVNDSTWQVVGHVDSQNGFGALVRLSFISVVKYRGDMVICMDAQVLGTR